MVHSVFHPVVSRLLSVATVLTLVGFAASADLQPASALASPGESADLIADASYLEDDNGNSDENRDENRDDNENRNNDENNNDDNNRNNNDENRNRDDNEKNGNNGNHGGQGIFSLICSVPGFANNAGCASGLLGN
jgi:hypothetical protein